MDSLTLTVYFEDPFWVGIFEREEAGRYSACRVVFGAEPRDFQVYDLIISRFHGLRFGPALPDEGRERRRKHRSRNDPREGVGTKAQQALQAQREAARTERKILSREEREAEAARRFARRREKKREKHRGH